MGDNLPTVDLGTFGRHGRTRHGENVRPRARWQGESRRGTTPESTETTCACGSRRIRGAEPLHRTPERTGTRRRRPVPGLGTICVESPTCRADERVSRARAWRAPPDRPTTRGTRRGAGTPRVRVRRRRARTRRTRRPRSRRPSRRTALRDERDVDTRCGRRRGARRRRRRTHRRLRNRRLILIRSITKVAPRVPSSPAWNLAAACIVLGFAASLNRYGAE